MEFTFASLMARAQDEPDTIYGLAARGVQISSDRLTYRFLLRGGITFHDGSPLTAHDVVFSLQVLKEKGRPMIQQMLQNFAGAQAPDDATVIVSLVPGYARDLPPVCCRAADLFTNPLCRSSLRGDNARSPIGLRPVQGWAI
jgi:microcin C transport system substrate-binding protein